MTLAPNPICQRDGCKKPGVWTPVFTVHTVWGPKKASATLSFCEDCRTYAIEKILPDLTEQAEYPFRYTGSLADEPTTFELVQL